MVDVRRKSDFAVWHGWQREGWAEAKYLTARSELPIWQIQLLNFLLARRGAPGSGCDREDPYVCQK